MTSPRRALIVIDAQQQHFDGLLAIEHPPRNRSVARIGESKIVASVFEGHGPGRVVAR